MRQWKNENLASTVVQTKGHSETHSWIAINKVKSIGNIRNHNHLPFSKDFLLRISDQFSSPPAMQRIPYGNFSCWVFLRWFPVDLETAPLVAGCWIFHIFNLWNENENLVYFVRVLFFSCSPREVWEEVEERSALRWRHRSQYSPDPLSGKLTRD